MTVSSTLSSQSSALISSGGGRGSHGGHDGFPGSSRSVSRGGSRTSGRDLCFPDYGMCVRYGYEFGIRP